MELEQYLTVYKNQVEVDEQKIEQEFNYFSINYDLWYQKTLYTQESNPNKPFDYDDKLLTFLNMQEENLINLVKLKEYNLKGIIYFDFNKFYKDYYYKLSSTKLPDELIALTNKFCK